MRALLLAVFLSTATLFGGNADCKCFFSPKDCLAEKLIERIDKEEKEIKIAIYSIQHAGIANALVRASERNVDVQVLVDPFSVKKKSSIHKLVEAKIPVYVWDKELCVSNRKGRRIMHDKFVLFGKNALWTGSFDFTNDSNLRFHENAILVESKEIAEKYREQFSFMRSYESRILPEYVGLHPKKRREKREKKSPSRYAKIGMNQDQK